ncbi:MAG: hypothetical protein SAL70_03245, partial [Scytonema sp. PMC 1070.18]|nr:hypothetical protein [Scytonema sp. PMC 1070.18]
GQKLGGREQGEGKRIISFPHTPTPLHPYLGTNTQFVVTVWFFSVDSEYWYMGNLVCKAGKLV